MRSPIAHIIENTELVWQFFSEDESEDGGARNVLAFGLAVGSWVSGTRVRCHSSAAVPALCEASLCLFSLHPGDLYPFTRKPLFIIVDSSNSVAYKVRLLKAATGMIGYSVNP